jgi:hypothetical protein
MENTAPDNMAIHFYGTVLHDQGKFRMWYYACHRGYNPDWPPRKKQQIAKLPGWMNGVKAGSELGQGPVCYAESVDGISWTRPALGQVLFKGSRDNNALDLPHTITSGAAVIRDESDPDPARRYKMVYQYFPDQTEPYIPENGGLPSIACAVSPDGINWTVSCIPFKNQFVEHGSFMRHQGRYIVHSQAYPGMNWGGGGCRTEGGHAGGRTGVARETCDFDKWPDMWAWAFALPEPVDPMKRGSTKSYDQVHLGVGAASFGNVCVGLYGLWHASDNFDLVSCDLALVVSNDGIRFRELGAMPGQAYIHRDDSPATPAPGHNYTTILCQGNGILNVGDETRIYHGRWRNCGKKVEDIVEYYSAEVALAVLPRDRWGSLRLNPEAQEGLVCSAPVTLPADGWKLTLNADGVTGLSVEVADEHLNLMPQFSGDNSATAQGKDGLDVPVKWAKGNPAELNGKTVRFRVCFKRSPGVEPMLYAVSLSA